MELLQHQEAALGRLRSASRLLIISKPGSGKTLIAIRFLFSHREKSSTVICPKSVFSQWEAYIHKYKLENTKLATFQGFVKSPDDFRAEIVVVDEPKMLKGPTLFYEALTSWPCKPFARILLDATPIENNLTELWYLFSWLKPKLFDDLQTFQGLYGSGRFYRNLDGLRANIAPYVFTPELKDYRPRVFETIKVPLKLKKEDMDYYVGKLSVLRRNLEKASKSKSLNALHKAFGKISQLRSFLSDPEKGSTQKVSNLINFLRKRPESSGVVFCFLRKTVKKIVEELRLYGISAEPFTGDLSSEKRKRLRERFNSKELRFLVATSAGERGLDLFSGNTIIHFDLPWTDASYNQRDRVTRLSSDLSKKTNILTLIFENSIEEVIWSIIANKHKLSLVLTGEDKVLFLNRKSWVEVIDKFLEGLYGKAVKNAETGEGFWFTRGQR